MNKVIFQFNSMNKSCEDYRGYHEFKKQFESESRVQHYNIKLKKMKNVTHPGEIKVGKLRNGNYYLLVELTTLLKDSYTCAIWDTDNLFEFIKQVDKMTNHKSSYYENINSILKDEDKVMITLLGVNLSNYRRMNTVAI